MTNPFDPHIGAIPAARALGPWGGVFESADARLLVGFEGSGKTVALDTIEQQARGRNWAVIAENATAGLVTRLRDEHLPALMKALGVGSTNRRVVGVSAPQLLGPGRQEAASQSELVRNLKLVAESLAAHDSGLLVTVDDVTAAGMAEIHDLIAAVSPLFTDRHKVRVVATMTPVEYGKALEHGEQFTGVTVEWFTALTDQAVRELFESTELVWEEQALTMAVAATRGYPLLVQLIGHYCWNAVEGAGTIQSTHVEAASVDALRKFSSTILHPLCAELSGLDVAFLSAVAAGDEAVKIADIAARMQRSADTVAQYRRRLANRGYITMVRLGWVDLALPGLREYFRSCS
ncbi:hypothetical protein [Corynebacterium sp.]|uniref:hypothetical protein n=1 Tax=Corynebacterium sp. TaxID=1720 RepID=UPI0026DDB457|nr:hypothetical protein [Corynebacterium sp.]MDO5077407.1 hypothetical protein [Corynebacterium sp.]